MSNNKQHISKCYTPGTKVKFFEGPTKSPEIRGNPIPNYMVGKGYENAGYVAVNAVKEETIRGIFTNTNRKNVLVAKDYS